MNLDGNCSARGESWERPSIVRGLVYLWCYGRPFRHRHRHHRRHRRHRRRHRRRRGRRHYCHRRRRRRFYFIS